MFAESLEKHSAAKKVYIMNRLASLHAARQRRVMRVRKSIRPSSRLRMSVHLTCRHVYVQLIDDCAGSTVISANSCEPDIAKLFQSSGSSTEAATIVGRVVAERALEFGVGGVVFDRGGRRFHGRLAALADSARKCGLMF